MCVCGFYGANIIAMALYATSLDSLLSEYLRRIYIVFLTNEFKDGGKPCHKTRKTAALRRGI